MGLNRYKARVSGRVMWEEFVWPSVDRPPVDWPQAEERLGWAISPLNIYLSSVIQSKDGELLFSLAPHPSHTLPPLILQHYIAIYAVNLPYVFSPTCLSIMKKVKVCYGKFVIIGDQKSMMNLTQFETKSGAKHSTQWQWNTILKIMTLA